MRISCPPRFLPHYGVDTPSEKQLIAANKSVYEISRRKKKYRRRIRWTYLSLEGLHKPAARGEKMSIARLCYSAISYAHCGRGRVQPASVSAEFTRQSIFRACATRNRLQIWQESKHHPKPQHCFYVFGPCTTDFMTHPPRYFERCVGLRNQPRLFRLRWIRQRRRSAARTVRTSSCTPSIHSACRLRRVLRQEVKRGVSTQIP